MKGTLAIRSENATRPTTCRSTGSGRLWPSQFWPIHFLCCCVVVGFGVGQCSVFVYFLLVCVAVCCSVLLCVCGGCSGPLRRTPLRRTPQNFALFFPLPPQLRDHIPGVHVQGAAAAWQALVVGFEAPQWAELAMGRRPPGWADDEDPTTPKRGWHYWATQPVNAQFMEATVRPRLNGRDPLWPIPFWPS